MLLSREHDPRELDTYAARHRSNPNSVVRLCIEKTGEVLLHCIYCCGHTQRASLDSTYRYTTSYPAVEMTAGMLKMRSRNRSCTSHAKKAVLEGKSFPRRRGAEAAMSRSEATAAARGESRCGETASLVLLLSTLTAVRAGNLQDADARWLKNPRALTAKNSSRPIRIQNVQLSLTLVFSDTAENSRSAQRRNMENLGNPPPPHMRSAETLHRFDSASLAFYFARLVLLCSYLLDTPGQQNNVFPIVFSVLHSTQQAGSLARYRREGEALVLPLLPPVRGGDSAREVQKLTSASSVFLVFLRG